MSIDFNDAGPQILPGTSPPPQLIDLNDAAPQVLPDAPRKAKTAKYDLDAIRAQLAADTSWFPRLFPNARISRDRKEARMADIYGRAPVGEGSCIMHLSGPRAGYATDFAGNESAGPIDLIGIAMGLQGQELYAEAARIAGISNVSVMPKRNGTKSLEEIREAESKKLTIKLIISGCEPLTGSLGAHYLSTRELADPKSPDLLFHAALRYKATNQGYPTLVAIPRDAHGEPMGGIHRTYLLDDGSAKAFGKDSRRSLGEVKGGAVRLTPIGLDGHLGIAEGIETALSATAIFGVPCWAALSASFMEAWDWPAETRRVTIFADARRAGEDAAAALAGRLKAASIPVEIRLPMQGDDFNDDLRKGVQAADYPEAVPAKAQIERAKARQDLVTQDSIALAFVEKAANKLRYCHGHGSWFYWNDRHWQRDETDRAFNYARTVAREQSFHHVRERDDKKAIARSAFAAGVERYARADPACAVSASYWDCDPWLLGTPDGTVDLNTGELRAPDPSDGITKLVAVAPAKSADCPKFLGFLKEATGSDDGLIRFLRQICGYCLTGVVREHVLLFIYGPGGTGKSTFLRILTDLLSAYAMTAPMTTFTAAPYDQHPTELAMLRGSRLVSAMETERDRAWAETRIKALTGGDPITARFMRQDFFTFIPQFKLLIGGNHAPRLHGVDDAIKRRMTVIPFKAKPAVPDRTLGEKLRPEWPGILRWMIDGCLDWRQNGLVIPDSVTKETERYLSEQAAVSEPFSEWLMTCCDCDPGNPHKTAVSLQLYQSWQDYASRAGHDAGSREAFAKALKKVGCSDSRGSGGVRMWSGIQLRNISYGKN